MWDLALGTYWEGLGQAPIPAHKYKLNRGSIYSQASRIGCYLDWVHLLYWLPGGDKIWAPSPVSLPFCLNWWDFEAGVRGSSDPISFPERGAWGGERGKTVVLEGCGGGLAGIRRGASIDASASSIMDWNSYNTLFRRDFTLDVDCCLKRW